MPLFSQSKHPSRCLSPSTQRFFLFIPICILVLASSCSVDTPPQYLSPPLSPSYDLDGQIDENGRTKGININFAINFLNAPNETGISVYYYPYEAEKNKTDNQYPSKLGPRTCESPPYGISRIPLNLEPGEIVKTYCSRVKNIENSIDDISEYERAEIFFIQQWCEHIRDRQESERKDRIINRNPEKFMIGNTASQRNKNQTSDQSNTTNNNEQVSSFSANHVPTITSSNLNQEQYRYPISSSTETNVQKQAGPKSNWTFYGRYNVRPGYTNGKRTTRSFDPSCPTNRENNNGLFCDGPNNSFCYYFALTAYDFLARIESFPSKTVQACTAAYVNGYNPEKTLSLQEDGDKVITINFSRALKIDEGYILLKGELEDSTSVQQEIPATDPRISWAEDGRSLSVSGPFLEDQTLSFDFSNLKDTICNNPVHGPSSWKITVQS